MLLFNSSSSLQPDSECSDETRPGHIYIHHVEWRYRKVPLSYSTHVRGYHPVYPGHGAIAFESLLERNVISALAEFPELERIESQPVTIFFDENGVRHRYTPDLLVTLSEVPFELECLGFGLRTFIECKPDSQVRKKRTELDRNFRAALSALTVMPLLITNGDLEAGILEVRNDA